MLEGTKNERAAIVSASYLIGFVTAFIAFGINQIATEAPALVINAPTIQHTASVIDSITPASTLTETPEGLRLVTPTGDSILLSVRRSTNTIAADTSDGLHTSLAHYELSPNGTYAYFCEIPVDGMNDCKPFVYSLSEDTIVPLMSDGQRIALTNTEQDITWNMSGVEGISGIGIDAQRF